MLFDPEIVSAVEHGNNVLAGEIAERKGKELFGPDDYTCVLGARDLVVEWVPEGEAFDISEYDGSESLHVISEGNYMRA